MFDTQINHNINSTINALGVGGKTNFSTQDFSIKREIIRDYFHSAQLQDFSSKIQLFYIITWTLIICFCVYAHMKYFYWKQFLFFLPSDFRLLKGLRKPRKKNERYRVVDPLWGYIDFLSTLSVTSNSLTGCQRKDLLSQDGESNPVTSYVQYIYSKYLENLISEIRVNNPIPLILFS